MVIVLLDIYILYSHYTMCTVQYSTLSYNIVQYSIANVVALAQYTCGYWEITRVITTNSDSHIVQDSIIWYNSIYRHIVYIYIQSIIIVVQYSIVDYRIIQYSIVLQMLQHSHNTHVDLGIITRESLQTVIHIVRKLEQLQFYRHIYIVIL